MNMRDLPVLKGSSSVPELLYKFETGKILAQLHTVNQQYTSNESGL